MMGGSSPRGVPAASSVCTANLVIVRRGEEICREHTLPDVLFPNTLSPGRGCTVEPLAQKVQICVFSSQSLAIFAEQDLGDVAVNCAKMAQSAVVPGADTALDATPVASTTLEGLVVSGEHQLASQTGSVGTACLAVQQGSGTTGVSPKVMNTIAEAILGAFYKVHVCS